MDSPEIRFRHAERIMPFKDHQHYDSKAGSKELFNFNFGDTGLELILSRFSDEVKAEPVWDIHFRPQGYRQELTVQKQREFVKKFALGLMSLISFLSTSSREIDQFGDELKKYPPESIKVSTNPRFGSFWQKITSPDYFVKLELPLQGLTPTQQAALIRLAETESWPYRFELGKLLKDYRNDPNILSRCAKVAAG